MAVNWTVLPRWLKRKWEDWLDRRIAAYALDPASEARFAALLDRVLAESPKDWLGDRLAAYALNAAHEDRFAALLERVLSRYIYWTWGQDGPYRRHFSRWQAAGFNLAPNHYYSPIPDAGRLPPDFFRRESRLAGLDLREARQLELLAEFEKYQPEYLPFSRPPAAPHEFSLGNGCLESCDAEVLHCMIRRLQPRRIIEAGAGYSTLLTAAACEANRLAGGPACEFTAIEPFPNHLFAQPIPGLTRLLTLPLEEADPALFASLGENDILFIDSSHVLKAGSDVERLYLEIIPALRPGVVVHVHDIFLPRPYPEHWMREEHIFWNEQQLLQAFLSFNREFEVEWASAYMHLRHRARLEAAFPALTPDSFPGSFWFRRRTGAS